MLLNLVTHTSPVLLHGPQHASVDTWAKLSPHFLSHPVPQPTLDLTAVTWSNRSDAVFIRNAADCRLPLQVYGQDMQPWDNYAKFDFNVTAAKQATTRYLLGCDALDVVITGELQRAIDYLEQSTAKLIFNGELVFFPQSHERCHATARQRQAAQFGVYRYLNSGVWIGEREFCEYFFDVCRDIRPLDMFEQPEAWSHISSGSGCDQSVMHFWQGKLADTVQIDTQANVFQNLAHVPPADVTLCPAFG